MVKESRDNEVRMDRMVLDQKETIRKYKMKIDELQSDQEFLKKQTMDAKRKNKLLKVAIERL